MINLKQQHSNYIEQFNNTKQYWIDIQKMNKDYYQIIKMFTDGRQSLCISNYFLEGLFQTLILLFQNFVGCKVNNCFNIDIRVHSDQLLKSFNFSFQRIILNLQFQNSSLILFLFVQRLCLYFLIYLQQLSPFQLQSFDIQNHRFHLSLICCLFLYFTQSYEIIQVLALVLFSHNITYYKSLYQLNKDSNRRTMEEIDDLDLMTDYKLKIPISQKNKNRLYLCWRNSKFVQCKMIGPQTKCFCNHRFKQHEYLNPKNNKPNCKASNCKCKCFDYVPTYGSYDFKCLCKHSYKEHDCTTHTCFHHQCKNCQGFSSAWTCSCGSKFADHITVIETYQERKSKGKNINDMMRLNEQITNATEQGSLYKPINIKRDPEERAKQKRASVEMGIKSQNKQKRQMIEDDGIEVYRFDKNYD